METATPSSTAAPAPVVDVSPAPTQTDAITQPEPEPEPEPEPQPSPARDAFLGMYELLVEVFVQADPKTTAIAARSSKTLTTPALDVLWRVIPRASFLFSLLCPLEGAASYDGHSCRRFDFARDLHPADWKRFIPYSRRVEELSGIDEIVGDRWNEPSHKALAKVSASRPANLTLVDVFPRLRRVTWNVYSHEVLRNMSMFLVPSLTFLEIKLNNVVEYKPRTDITYDTLNLLESKKFLTHPHAPKQLVSLCVTSNRLEAPHQIQDFLTAISETLVNLQDLDIGLTFPFTDAPGHTTDITATTLRPLHLLPKLSHFGLAAHFPLKMDDAELDALTDCAWGRHLKVLWLNETPAYAVQREIKSDLTLKALAILARNCPNLEELTKWRTLEDLMLGKATESVPEFKRLRYLNLGVLHLSSPTIVANFIADLISTTDPDDIEPSTISPLLSAIPLLYRRPNSATPNGPRTPYNVLQVCFGWVNITHIEHGQ
ncbi:hypothetical protein FRB90_006454 [Tulasnella sp. 427]|nr:hypothetical protein FRB90_006454 [Tulasnella sp. 427]